MACYKCGGEGGTEVTVCPACRDARLNRRTAVSSPAGQGIQSGGTSGGLPFGQGSASDNSSNGVGGFVLKIIGVLILLGAAGYFVGFSAYGPGLALSPSEKVYKKCMLKMQGEMGSLSTKMKIKQDPTGVGASIGNAMEGMMQGLASGLGASVCVALRDNCSNDPNGVICKGAMNGM